jgi:lysophospholipase L1-like esterase
MFKLMFCLTCVLCLTVSSSAQVSAPTTPPTTAPKAEPKPERWESDLKRIEEHAKQHPQAQGNYLFVGSSTVRLWDLQQAFPDQAVLNHGFGGSQMSDIVQHFERLITPWKAKLIVIYSGDNDLAANKTPEQVVTDTEQLLKLIQTKSPQSRVLIIGVKPSPKRAKLKTEQQHTNHLLQKLVEKQQANFPKLELLDLGSTLLNAQGEPIAELYKTDQLHLSPAGYTRWNTALRKHLQLPELPTRSEQ